MSTCPSGHVSITDDYCDQCGAKIGGTAALDPLPPSDPSGAGGIPGASAVGAADPSATARVGGAPCPHCQTPTEPSDLFCEVCGYDFASGSLPAAPIPVSAAAPPPAPSAGLPSPAVETTDVTTPPASSTDPAVTAPTRRGGSNAGDPRQATWELRCDADRSYYDRSPAPEVPFPTVNAERVFPLVGDRLLVGRRSESRNIHPDVDLSGSPEDTGISRSQATLTIRPDDTWDLCDPGSTNGTFVNEGADPIAHGVSVALADGDRFHIGAWTTLTLRRRPEATRQTPPTS